MDSRVIGMLTEDEMKRYEYSGRRDRRNSRGPGSLLPVPEVSAPRYQYILPLPELER